MTKTKKFKNKKLVRDKIISFLENKGIKTNHRYLEEDEYIACLKAKLIEEASEVSEETERGEIIKEIGDVYEVLETLSETLGVSIEEIKQARDLKNAKNGKFKEKIYLEYVEVAEDHADIGYYLNKFGQYPEMEE